MRWLRLRSVPHTRPIQNTFSSSESDSSYCVGDPSHGGRGRSREGALRLGLTSARARPAGVRPANPRDTASAPPAPATGDHAGFEPDACSETVGGSGGAARLGAPEAGTPGTEAAAALDGPGREHPK